MLFRTWQIAVGLHFTATLICVLIHQHFASPSVNRFRRYALISSQLLLLEVLTSVLAGFYVEPSEHQSVELVLRILGRLSAATGMTIWAGYLMGFWNGVHPKPQHVPPVVDHCFHPPEPLVKQKPNPEQLDKGQL